MKKLCSNTWQDTAEAMRKCHLSALSQQEVTLADWKKAFDMLIISIEEERTENKFFSPELANLTEETGCDYDFADILEDYFDYLEDADAWADVIASSEKMLKLFAWESKKPSEYMYRKGNALQKLERYEEAEAFGNEWMEKYPDDLYASASNAFLYLSQGKLDEAKAITEKCLSDELICDNTNDTLFMAAYRLYEMTDNINAKQRVEKKMAEYNAMMNK